MGFYDTNETALIETEFSFSRELTVYAGKAGQEKTIPLKLKVRCKGTLRDFMLKSCSPAIISFQNGERKRLENAKADEKTLESYGQQVHYIDFVPNGERKSSVQELTVGEYKKNNPAFDAVPDDVLIGIVNSTGGKIRLVENVEEQS